MTEKEKSGHSLPASGVHALDGCKEHHGNKIITQCPELSPEVVRWCFENLGNQLISMYSDFPVDVVKWCFWSGREPRQWKAEQKKKSVSQLIEESGGYGLTRGKDTRRIMADWHKNDEMIQITLWNQGE